MNCNNKGSNGCRFNVKTFGVCDVSRVTLDGSNRTLLNWNEVSIPEVVCVPMLKPQIEHLDQVYVDAKLTCAKLIETPFAYRSYERVATAMEITAVTNVVNLANTITISAIVEAVEDILDIEDLPVIPAVAALQAALAAVVAAAADLTAAIDAALDYLAGQCISVAVLVTLLTAIQVALNALHLALQALVVAANALVAATAGIPIVGPLVEAAVDILLAAISVVEAIITATLTAISQVLALLNNTHAFEIIPNEEGACLSGRKLVVEGVLSQKIIYTALVATQTVHSFCNDIPFNAYIIPYANFVGLTYQEGIEVIADPAVPCETTTINGFLYDPEEPIVVNLCEEFSVDSCIEDIFAYAVDTRNVFKNVTLFLWAKPIGSCD